MRRSLPLLALLAAALPGVGAAYPGGTPTFVTDVAPFCTSCHTSVSAEQLQGVPPQRVASELPDAKHLAKIRAAKADTPYAKLTPEQRAALVAGIEAIDAAARVELVAPPAVAAGEVFEVTLRATGGAGPVVGLALVDSDQRWQARPAPSVGWTVVAKPSVTGPDGQPQTRFTDGRNPELAPGISYVNVYDVVADPGSARYSTVAARFRLRAPSEPGSYPLAGVFLYGTEKAAPHGAVESVQGKVPLGGFTGSSGRVRFTPVQQIEVR